MQHKAYLQPWMVIKWIFIMFVYIWKCYFLWCNIMCMGPTSVFGNLLFIQYATKFFLSFTPFLPLSISFCRCCSFIVIDVFSILFVQIYGISMHMNSFPARIYVSNFVLKKMQNKSCITKMVMGRIICAVAVVGALVLSASTVVVCVRCWCY